MSALKNNLFKPITVGRVQLTQRIAMAPLTRVRADPETAVPTEVMETYYKQRSQAPGTLIVSEATVISERARAYRGVPGVWSPEQVSGWKKITSTVHQQDSFIFQQLWAVGRAANPKYLSALGNDFVSSSNVPDLTNPYHQEGVIPRALTADEIKEYVKDFAQAAQNSVEAGFDGIEIHAANGYLLHQFLDDSVNHRTDNYGGSVENRARFTLEVVDAICKAIGADRVAIRLSPYETYGDMKYGPATLEQYAYLLKELEERGLQPGGRLAYIHTVENTFDATNSVGEPILKWPLEFVRNVWTGVWIRTQHFSRDLALKFADVDDKLVIGFGKMFISNPDLVRRIKEDLPLATPDFTKLYTGGASGYTDYPEYGEKN